MDSLLIRTAQKIIGGHVKKVRQSDQPRKIRLILALLIHLIPTQAFEAQIFRRFRLCLSPTVPNFFEPVQQLEGRLRQGTVLFVTVGQLFPYVLYTMPVLNAYLQELAVQVNDAVSGIPETTVSKYYHPHSWLPHVTLGKTLSKEQMRQAFAVMQDKFSVFDAKITELGLAKVNPHEDVLRFGLLP